MKRKLFYQHTWSKSLIIGIAVIFIIFFLGIQINKMFFIKQKVTYIRPEKKEVMTTIRATGVVVPSNILEVKSFISGIVVEANYEDGDQVKKGDQLVALDAEEILQEIEVAQANKEQAKVDTEVSQATLAQVQISAAQAKNEVELAAIKLEEAKKATDIIEKEEVTQAQILYDSNEKEVENIRRLVENKAYGEEELRKAIIQKDLAQSKLRIAEEQLEQARDKIKRKVEEVQKTLEQSNKAYEIAMKALEVARASYQSSIAAYNTSEKSYENAKVRLKYYSLYAPMEGKILNKNIIPGDYIQPGETLYRVMKSPLLIEMNPDERELGKIVVGTEGWISPEAYPNLKLKVKVYKISPEVDPQRGTVKVYLNLEYEDERLLPNMTTSVELMTSSHQELLLIPVSYIINEGEQSHVYVYDNGKVKQQEVVTGRETKGVVEILEGITEKDIIVFPDQIKQGMEVELEE